MWTYKKSWCGHDMWSAIIDGNYVHVIDRRSVWHVYAKTNNRKTLMMENYRSRDEALWAIEQIISHNYTDVN